MNDQAMFDARVEAVSEVAASIIKAAGDALQRHGNDPNSRAILAAGFVMAIDKITSHIDPGFKTVIKRMVQ